ARAHRRRGGAGGEQQRGRRPAGGRHPRRRPRGGGLTRRAGRDRWQLPHAGGDGHRRRSPAGGRDDEPHPPRRLSARRRSAYGRAAGPEPGLSVKPHTSNSRIVGSTASLPLPELVAVARAAGVPVLDDLGSGALVDLTDYGLPREPLVGERVAAGADLVTFS